MLSTNNKKASKQQKQNRNKQQKRKVRVVRGSTVNMGLSDCVYKYKVAISDPWNLQADGACIPRHPTRPSQKVKLFTRVPITMTSGGKLYIAVVPCLAKDIATVYYAVVGSTVTLPYPVFNTTNCISYNPGNTALEFTSFTGSFSGGILTVTALVGEIAAGSTYNMSTPAGLPPFTVYEQLSGPPMGLGRYRVSLQSTVASTAYTAGSRTNAADNPAVSVATINSPYTSGMFSSVLNETATTGTVSGRLVSVGASIQYTGTLLNQGGTYYMYTSPDHSNINSPAYVDLGACAEAFVERITSKKQWIMTSSISDAEMNYPDQSSQESTYAVSDSPYGLVFPYSGGAAMCPGLYLGGVPIMIQANVPNAASFELEVVQHVEFVGPATQAFISPTHSDARGFELVSNASAMIPQLRTAMPNVALPSLMDKAIAMAQNALRPVAYAAGRGVVDALSSRLGRMGTGVVVRNR